MEFKNLSVLALFLLALVGINGSESGEKYWKSVWPNTPIPKALSDLLLSDMETNMPIKIQDENQYWTIFFEHDLYPGKTMKLGIHKHSNIQSSKLPTYLPIKKASLNFRKSLRETQEKENQPFGFWIWDKNETAKENQPFGVGIWWHDKKTDKPNQSFESSMSDKQETIKENQPFGFWIWDRKETTKENQPFGFWIWDRKETTRENQPFVRDTLKESQDSVAYTSDEKEAHIIDKYCRNPSAIGEDKHCVFSLDSMMNFAILKLGKNIKVMSSSFVQNQENYVVDEVNKIGDKVVMCHRLNFKTVVFYCHAVNASTTYMVPLVASDGSQSKALTICHHDTRGMNPNMLHELLNVMPGTVPICHFIGNKAIAWVPDMSEPSGHPCVV